MMIYSDYSIVFDRTGFPLIQLDSWDHSIGLFPVSKYQFERFLVDDEGSDYTDEWYRGVLELNPRRSWRNPGDRVWELFITGLDLDVIEDFLGYLGPEYRLPTLDEWKALLELSEGIAEVSPALKMICNGRSPEPVLHWLEAGLCPLMREGIFERIHGIENRVAGKPFHGLLPNTWAPEELKEVKMDMVQGMIGFRVVRG
ncbi:formylglycine-generating enzyme family protein [Methanothermobacter defluvii]|nr:formylglycine-generating enzyme family protein [Methanothermobacter defluvii]